MNTDETELERLREENRHLRSLLAVQTAEAPDTARRDVEAQRQIAEQEQALKAIADAGEHNERLLRLYETILSSTPDLVYVFDRNYRFTFVNDALLNMWGRSLEDSVGKSLLEIGYEPWHAEMHEREIDQVIATRQSIRGEVPFPHATLGLRIYDYIFVPVLGVDGEVEAIAGTTRDVTESKRAAREIEVLNERLRRAMRETHHRVKNNLQVISAMAEMHSDGSALVPATAVHRIGLHARNLATLHDLLTQEAARRSEIDSVSVRSALNELTPLLQAAAGGRPIECVSDEFALPVTECSSLTMLIAELVSNAVKHGSGAIQISLHRAGERATLQVYDQGAGFPAEFDPSCDANTGLELALMLARHDLRGSIAFENAPEGGARVSVVFPL